jgi:hypothetical protein
MPTVGAVERQMEESASGDGVLPSRAVKRCWNEIAVDI